MLTSSSFFLFRVNSFLQSPPKEASQSHPSSIDKFATLGSCDVLMDSSNAVLMRMTRHARSRRVNKQYGAAGGERAEEGVAGSGLRICLG